MLDHKMINKEDLNIFKVMDDPEEIVGVYQEVRDPLIGGGFRAVS